MLWRPVTYGEDLFLRLYAELGQHLEVRGPQDIGLEFLVSPARFVEFTRLAATLEIFLRCVRTAKDFFEAEGHLPAAQIAHALRQQVDLPSRLYGDREFCECAKQAGHIASTKPRPPSVERNAMRTEPRDCYLCGIRLRDVRAVHDQFTIEHLWPLTFGGATVEDNLLPACKNCNDSRKHFITWAWGPVQSTFHASSKGEDPPRELRLALALARIMLTAGGSPGGRRLLTLKQAAKKIRPAVVTPTLKHGRHYVFFELFPVHETMS